MGQSISRRVPMGERFSDIEKPGLSKRPSLEERLKEYPELKAKIEAMLAIIENAGGDVAKAAEAAGHRGIAPDGERGLTGLGPPSAREKGNGVQRQAGRESQRKKTSTGTRDWEKSK